MKKCVADYLKRLYKKISDKTKKEDITMNKKIIAVKIITICIGYIVGIGIGCIGDAICKKIAA